MIGARVGNYMNLYLLTNDGTWIYYTHDSGALPNDIYRITDGDTNPIAPSNIPKEFWDKVIDTLKTDAKNPDGDPNNPSHTEESDSPEPTDEKKTDKDTKTRPIPLLPDPRNPDKPDKPDDPDNPDDPKAVDDNIKKRTSGVAMLRPFFSTYNGIDLLQQTEKEALEDIHDYDLFDLPIDEIASLTNPLFVHNLHAASERYNGLGNPALHKLPTAKQISGQISTYLNTRGFVGGNLNYDKAAPYTNNAIPTEMCFMDANPLLNRDNIPWHDPYLNIYARGFGDANRTDSSLNVANLKSLYADPDRFNALVNPQLQSMTPPMTTRFDNAILSMVRHFDGISVKNKLLSPECYESSSDDAQ